MDKIKGNNIGRHLIQSTSKKEKKIKIIYLKNKNIYNKFNRFKN